MVPIDLLKEKKAANKSDPVAHSPTNDSSLALPLNVNKCLVNDITHDVGPFV